MLKATQCIEQYVLRECLERSAFIETWKAFDSHLQRDVVMKLLLRSHRTHLDLIQSFLQDARSMAALQHPNIVHIYDIAGPPFLTEDEEADEVAAFLVMPDIHGMTLADYISRTSRIGKFPRPIEIIQLCTGIGRAIDYAHLHGVIHGNLTPTNVLLDQQIGPRSSGLPILIDFGLAKLHSMTTDDAHNISIVVGSPSYIAPEQARGNPPTEQSDLYMLGTILYELCTGKLPFEALEQRPLTLLFQKMTFAPVRPSWANPSIAPELEAVILQSIAKEPGQRFPNAQAMTRALAQVLSVSLSRTPTTDLPALSPAPIRELGRSEEKVAVIPEHEMAALREEPGRAQSEAGAKVAIASRMRARPELPLRRFTISSRGPLRPWFVLLCILSLLVVIGLFLFSSGSGRSLLHSQPITPVAVGQVFFLSSGQSGSLDSQGLNDEVQIDLTHLPAPAPRKVYLAWLQGDLGRSDGPVVFLGQLKVSQNAASLTYINPQHTDLLITMSRFLVTEEDAGASLQAPSQDKATWKYSGAISQAPDPTDQHHYSLLDHLRHLLAADPVLEPLGLHGGLSLWFYKNSGRAQEAAQNAQKSLDAADAPQLHRYLVTLLDYLDGSQEVSHDVPPGTPIFADALSVQVGLLQIQANQNPSSYVYHIGFHLAGLLSAPGATPGQRKIAVGIVQALNEVNALLTQVRTIAGQLVTLSPQQLLQARIKAQLANLVQATTTAYVGSSGNHEGIVWIHQQLAALALIPVTQSA